MTRIVSLMLASVVAFGALATVVTPAAADGPRYYQGWHQHQWGGPGEWHGDHDGWGVGGALLGGTVLELALGATLYNPPPPPPMPNCWTPVVICFTASVATSSAATVFGPILYCAGEIALTIRPSPSFAAWIMPVSVAAESVWM